MRAYELVFIAVPDLEKTALDELVEKVAGWIKDGDGSIAKIDRWGKRELAYPIRKLKEGQYVLMDIQMDPANCAGLERNLRLTEPVMRYLLVGK